MKIIFYCSKCTANKRSMDAVCPGCGRYDWGARLYVPSRPDENIYVIFPYDKDEDGKKCYADGFIRISPVLIQFKKKKIIDIFLPSLSEKNKVRKILLHDTRGARFFEIWGGFDSLEAAKLALSHPSMYSEKYGSDFMNHDVRSAETLSYQYHGALG